MTVAILGSRSCAFETEPCTAFDFAVILEFDRSMMGSKGTKAHLIFLMYSLKREAY